MLTLGEAVISVETRDADVPMSYIRKLHKALLESGYASGSKVSDSDLYEMIDSASNVFQNVIQTLIIRSNLLKVCPKL